MNILVIGMLFCIQLLIFFSFGLVVCKLLRKPIEELTLTLVTGFTFCFCIFGIFAVPFTLANFSLSSLAYVWMTVCGLIVIMSGVLYFKELKQILSIIPLRLKEHGWVGLLLYVVIFVQMWIVFTHIDSSVDASYYIGKVTTDVYTNTIGHFDPQTGKEVLWLESRRLYACFPEYNAVISAFFHIHPLKQAKLIMPEIIIVMVNIIYYHIGLALFDKNRKKAVGLVCFCFIFNWYSNTIYTSSAFLFTRTYEGKSILANFIIPALLYCFIQFWQGRDTLSNKWLLMGISISSCVFSASSMLIVPVGITAGIIPWIWKEKKYKYMGWYILWILPNVLVVVQFYLAELEIVSYLIN